MRGAIRGQIRRLLSRYLWFTVYVWVHAQNELEDGEIGIFYHDGEGFIKKLEHHDGKTFLISLNHRKYQPREIKEEDVFLVYGQVVG